MGKKKKRELTDVEVLRIKQIIELLEGMGLDINTCGCCGLYSDRLPLMDNHTSLVQFLKDNIIAEAL